MDFAIPRAWCSYGGIDSNGINSVNNARAAGMPYVDIYMFPCRGKSATDQVNQLFSYVGSPSPIVSSDDQTSARGMSAGIKEDFEQRFDMSFESDFKSWRAANVKETDEVNGLNFGMVWIDVEINPSSGCSWASYSASSNCDYVNELINAVWAHGKQPGVYSSIY
jgi:hypothetical protein